MKPSISLATANVVAAVVVKVIRIKVDVFPWYDSLNWNRNSGNLLCTGYSKKVRKTSIVEINREWIRISTESSLENLGRDWDWQLID